MPDYPAEVIQPVAKVLLRQYADSSAEHHLSWRDFTREAREVLDAAAPALAEAWGLDPDPPSPAALMGTLGARLAAARKQLGWSLRQAERHSGVPNAHISQIETGTIARPEAATLIRLADAYALPPAELMAMAGRDAEFREVQALRDHLGRDHAVMVQLGRIADAAVKMLEHISMDTDEDCELHARAVGALRARLDEIAATMKEANEAAREDAARIVREARNPPEVPGA